MKHLFVRLGWIAVALVGIGVGGIAAAETPEPGEVRTFSLGEAASIEMVYVAPGSFVMGSAPSEPDHSPEREAQRLVEITRGFWLGQTELTQQQYEAVVGSNPSRNVGPKLPVEQVSFAAAVAFAARVSGKGGSFRLPTEAEWEYACRAGQAGQYPAPRDEITWHRENSGRSSHPVASKAANPWGLFDMNGNVGELVSDWLSERSLSNLEQPLVDPQGPATGEHKMLRGGQFTGRVRHTRCADRQQASPSEGYFFAGFRLLRELDRSP